MKELTQLTAALFGSLGFAALFNIRSRKLAFATLGGLAAWAIYLAAACITDNPYLCGFAASVVITLYAECMARIHKTPVTVFLVSAAVPLIPGAALYRSMDHLVHQRWESFAAESAYTLLFAASMSAGITFTTLGFRFFWKCLRREKRV